MSYQLCKQIHRHGGIIIGVQTSNGGLFNDNGLDPA
jgi:glutamate dehydrogenase/leucine dehydrogenase